MFEVKIYHKYGVINYTTEAENADFAYEDIFSRIIDHRGTLKFENQTSTQYLDAKEIEYVEITKVKTKEEESADLEERINFISNLNY